GRHLHRALAEGAGADDHRPGAVLQGADEQFGRAHRPAVDERDQGSGGVAAGAGVQGTLLAVDVVGGDQAAVEEGGGGGDGLGHQPAGVAAQVEDDPGAGRAAAHGPADLGAGALGEGGHLDQGDRTRQLADGDGVPRQADPAQRLGPHPGAALEADAHGAARGLLGGVAAQYGDDLGDRASVHLPAVDAAQPVAGADAGLLGGGAAAHPGDLDAAVALAGPQADAGVLAVEDLLELLVLARRVDGAPAV